LLLDQRYVLGKQTIPVFIVPVRGADIPGDCCGSLFFRRISLFALLIQLASGFLDSSSYREI